MLQQTISLKLINSGKLDLASVYKARNSRAKAIEKFRIGWPREFKNKVTSVAKLQHKNLVKLVDFSLADEEKKNYSFMSLCQIQALNPESLLDLSLSLLHVSVVRNLHMANGYWCCFRYVVKSTNIYLTVRLLVVT